MILRVTYRLELKFVSGFTQDIIQNFLRKYELGDFGMAKLGWSPRIKPDQGTCHSSVEPAGGVWSVPVAEIGLAASDGYMRT